MEKNKLKDIIPGFRTNTFWKKVVAIFGYIFLIFIFIVILTTPSEYGNRTDARVEKIYNAITALMITGIPFIIITDFMGIRDKLPLFKKHKIGFTILGSFITYIVIAIGCSITTMAATGLYSEEYFADRQEAQEQREMEEAKKKIKKEVKRKAEEEKKAKEEAKRKAEEEKKAKEEAKRKAEEEKKAKEEAKRKEYIFPDSDKKYLTEEEVLGIDANVLKMAKNEIFARHGYIFKSKEIKEYFQKTSWYKEKVEADNFNSDKVFNDFEKKNVELIKKVENELKEVNEEEKSQPDDSDESYSLEDMYPNCIEVSSDELIRTPSKYDGKNIMVRGSVYKSSIADYKMGGFDDILVYVSNGVYRKNGEEIEYAADGDYGYIIGTFHSFSYEYYWDTVHGIDDAMIILDK